MYQVLFAEDELLVRLGLQNSIDWKAYDMELAAQADNGPVSYTHLTLPTILRV